MVARAGEVPATMISQGDTLILGENLAGGVLTTVGAGTWLAAQIASGIITRSGPVAGYTDTTDTANNILTALAGNGSAADLQQGSTFRMLFVNTVAQLMTLAAGTGVTLDTTNGTGVVNCAASLVREYLFTINNNSPETTQQCNFLTTTKIINFNLRSGESARPMQGSNGSGLAITSGMIVSGTNIAAGTKVVGLIAGQGGITGVTVDTNTTGTQTNTAVTFSPSITISSLGTRGA
jgi:hypothetical protein